MKTDVMVKHPPSMMVGALIREAVMFSFDRRDNR
jgi:hypothetical protein